jgi:membrane fusion protein, multidrug efflux system
MKATPRQLARKAVAIGVGAAVLLAAATVSFTSRANRAPAPAALAPAVSVAPVIERPVTEWDEFSGRVQAVEHVEVRPRISGTIDVIHFREGQMVRAGDLLFTIDPRPYQAELARVEAALAGARARLALSRTELDRDQRLIELHAVAQREVDQSEDALREADANVKAQEAAVLAARLNLEYTAIRAPVAGRISRAEITVGNLVGAGPNAPVLTTLVSVSPVYVNFEIDEQAYIRYAARGASGSTGVDQIAVAVGLASEESYPHRGYVKSIDNQLDTSSGTVRVRAVLDNSSGVLTPGLFARVRMGGAPDQPRLLIDDRAVGTDQDKKFVMVLAEGNKVKYRPVTLGPVIDGLRIVRAGLHKGEQVVVNGLQRVHPNDVVVPTTVGVAAGGTPAAKPAVVAAASRE